MTVHRCIIYPYILKLCDHITSNFWKTIFENLAYGITIDNCSIQFNNVCSTVVDTKCKLEKDDINLYTKLMDIFEQSLTDNERNLLFLENSITKVSIKKKMVKDILLERFILSIKKTYNLTLKQAKHILLYLSFALLFKIITSNDILYTDDDIESITYLTMSTNSVVLNKELYSDTNNIILLECIDKPTMSCLWKKHVSSLKKMIV